MNVWRTLARATLAAVVLCGCGPPPEPAPGPHAPPPPPPPARATEPALRIGILPEQNVFRQLEHYEPLARHVGRKAGIRLELRPLAHYGQIVSGIASGDLDGGFFGSFTYVLAHTRTGLVVLARPEFQNGRSTYFGLVLVRANSGLNRAEDLRGKRFAFVDRATTAGYLIGLDFFARAGIREPSKFLGESYFAGTHEDVIHDVLEGRAEAGVAKSSVLERMVGENPVIAHRLAALMRSPDFPENALALHPRVLPEARDAIKAALLGLDKDPDGRAVLQAFGARRFVETSDADYETVYRYARESGIDLAHYDISVER